MTTQSRIAAMLMITSALFPMMGQECLQEGLVNLLDEPAVSVSPESQDISDVDFAILQADTVNVPPQDDKTQAARLVWTIESGGGTLTTAGASDLPPQDGSQIEVTPGDEILDRQTVYHPDLGASGEVIVKVELRQRISIIVREKNPNDPNGPLVEHVELEDRILSFAMATITVNNELGLSITPPRTTLPSGGTVRLSAVFLVPGSDHGPDPDVTRESIKYEWNLLGTAGAGSLEGVSADTDNVTFRAFNEKAAFVITCRTTETFSDGSERVSGPVSALVDVDPQLKTAHTFGYYLASDESDDADFYYVVAWVYVPKIEGAVSYSVIGEGMHDAAYYGDGAQWSFSAANGVVSGMEDAGGAYRFGLSGASGANAGGGSGGAYAWMAGRFSGMRVIVTVVYQ